MNYSELNHSGYIHLKSKKHVAYDLVDGYLTIHAYEYIKEFERKNWIIGVSFDRKQYLFYTRLPISLTEYSGYPRNYRYPIDCIIGDYVPNSKFTKALFSFSELQYFCSSVSVATITTDDDGEKVIFSMTPKLLQKFSVKIDSKECTVEFLAWAKGNHGIANSKMVAKSYIAISFEETKNLEFLEKVYLTVDAVFAFICNRKNITCTKMTGIGIAPFNRIRCIKMKDGSKNNKLVSEDQQCKSEFYFIDKYRADPEDEKTISKTIYLMPLFKHLEKLFELVAEDVTNEGADTANISIASIHPSLKRKRLIDLQQSLHITAAFEFYVRRYLPVMNEEKEHHKKLKKLLEEFANTNGGKAKKLAKALCNHVVSEPALSDKIMKAYNGYGEWKALKPCIHDQWFREETIRSLALEANSWRNELAHEKRTYEPSVKTIEAVRLIEHLNYAIVLRQLACTDDEIMDLLSHIFDEPLLKSIDDFSVDDYIKEQ